AYSMFHMIFNQRFLILFLALSFIAAVATDFEKPSSVKTSSILPPDLLKGPYHQVNDSVSSDGYSYAFTIKSNFGDFQAGSLTELRVRIQEIQSIAQLKEITGGEAFAKAAGAAATKSFEATANVIQNPVETVKGVPSGVKRKFENIGRMVKRSSKKDEEETQTEASNKSSGVAQQVFGVTAAHRQWAEKVGADPYSRNAVLQHELQRLAKYDAAGKLGTNIARPKVQPFQAIRRVNELVWGMDPQALQKLNEQRLKEIGADSTLSQQFLNHKNLTLTDVTDILASLVLLKQAADRTEFIRSSLSSESEEDALFYRDSAAMLEQMQTKGTTITRFLPNPKITVALCGKRFVAVIPSDKLYWTQSFATALTKFTDRHKTNIQNSKSKELWLSGSATDRARKELASRGWTVQEDLLIVKEKTQ
ncbi:hypothetical protein L0244_07785, partial [bacterium]|nr:hypothetical protein [bacterium]